MPTYNEITLAKELIRFPSITPIDAGVMKFLTKKLTAIGFKCKILEFKDRTLNQLKTYMQDWVILNQTLCLLVTWMWFLQEI